jgi:hypothetical protein
MTTTTEEWCREPHPEDQSLRCILQGGSHEFHMVPRGSAVSDLMWANVSFVAPLPPSVLSKAAFRDHVRQVAEAAHDERTGIAQDPTVDALGPSHHSAPETSINAAFLSMPRSGSYRWRVLDAITRSDGGLTDEELQDQLDLPPNTQRPRRVELVQGGWVEDSGRRRITITGTPAVVWVPSMKARTALAVPLAMQSYD